MHGVSASAAKGQPVPVLFGNARSRRPGCLQPLMHGDVGVIAVRHVWSDAALAQLLKRFSLFVNLHKDSAYGSSAHIQAGRSCAQPEMPLESVRIAQLLRPDS